MAKHLDRDYQNEIRVKTYVEMAVRFFLSVKDDEYQKLNENERRIFDNMYPELVERDRFINLVSQFADYLSFGAGASVVGHTIAAGIGLMALSGFLTAIAVGFLAFGIAVSVASVVYREFAVNRKREAILKEGGVQVAFKAFHDLTKGRDDTLEQLKDLEHYYDNLGAKLRVQDPDNSDFKYIITETKKWVEDARKLLSDEAVNIIKDGILNQRDATEKPSDSDVKLEDVVRDLYEQRIQGKVKEVALDPITHLKDFKTGWRNLTKLSPDECPEIISRINYDMLYQDYVDNRACIQSSISALNMVADAINSDDQVINRRMRKSSKAVADQLRAQSARFASKNLSRKQVGDTEKSLSIDSNKLVSGQRMYNPAKIIESGFSNIDESKPKSVLRSVKKAASKALGLSKKSKDQLRPNGHDMGRHP